MPTSEEILSGLGVQVGGVAKPTGSAETLSGLGVLLPDETGDREVDIDAERLAAIRSGEFQKEAGIKKMSQMERKIKAALEEGDPEAAEFLRSQMEESGSEQTIGGVAKEIGFRASRRWSNLVDKITGEKKKTALSEEVPELTTPLANLIDPKLGYVESMRQGLVPPVNPGRLNDMALAARSEGEFVQMLKNDSRLSAIFPDSKGNLYAVYDNGFVGAVNAPGASWMDVDTIAQKGLLFALTSGRGTITKQALKAMGTQSVLEGVSAGLGGTFDPEEVVLAGVMEGVGAKVAQSIGKWYAKANPIERRSVKSWEDLKGKIPQEDFSRLKALKEATKTLNAPEVTGPQFAVGTKGGEAVRAQSDVARSVKNLDDAVRFADKTAAQDLFARKEIKRQLEAIPSGPDAIGDGVRRVKDASENVTEFFKEQRRVVANRTYGEAFKENAQVDIRPIRQQIKKALSSGVVYKGDEQKALLKAYDFLKSPRTGTNVLSAPAKDVQKVKFELDSMINGTSSDSAGGAARDALVDVRNKLVEEIEKVSPGYMKANALYAKGTEQINDLQKTMIGVIEGTAESRLGNVINLFENKDISSIKRLKGLIDSEDPSAFPALYKGWLSNKVSRMNLRESKNPSEKLFNELFAKDDTAKRIFTFAPYPQARENLIALKNYLRYSKNLRVSSTQGEAGLLQQTAEAARQQSVQGAPATAARGIGGFFEKRKADALMEAILNPRWAEDMKYIRSLNAKAQAEKLDELLNAIAAMSQEADVADVME